jgi:putative ABC transport system permease protein
MFLFLLVALVSAITRIFIVVYAREVFSQSDGMVSLYTVFGGLGALMMGMIIKFLVDRVGAKPLYITCIIVGFVSLLPAIFFPRGAVDNTATVIPYLSFLFFIVNFGFLGAEGIAQTYFLSLIPAKEMLDLGILYFFIFGIGGGGGSFLAGIFLDAFDSLGLSVFITFKVLDFADMTVDGSFALGGSVSAVFIVAGISPALSLLFAFIAGGLAGVVTGLLHTKLKIPGILAGILSMIALYSINIRIMGRANTPLLGITTLMSQIESVTGLNKTLTSLLAGVFFSAVIIGLLYWFFGTELGSAIRATGNNEKMIRALGVDTDKMKIIGLLLADALVALSGALVAQSQGYADVGMGTGTIVIGLASIIIGEVFFSRVRSFWAKLLACVFGSVVYRIIIAIVLQLGLKSTDLKLLTAVIVAISLSIPVFRHKYMKKVPLAVEETEVSHD